jgi:hypothetical protein
MRALYDRMSYRGDRLAGSESSIEEVVERRPAFDRHCLVVRQ